MFDKLKKSRKSHRRHRRPGAAVRRKSDNYLYEPNKYAVIIPLGLSWVVILSLAAGILFMFGKKSLNKTEGKIAAEQMRTVDLSAQLKRETALWEQERTPAQLRLALLRNGEKMEPSIPRNRQVAMGPLPEYVTGPGEKAADKILHAGNGHRPANADSSAHYVTK